MKSIFPKIKKSLKSYVLNDDGKISKQSLISIGAFLGGAALAGILESTDGVAHANNHNNNISLQIINDHAIGQHTHHASY